MILKIVYKKKFLKLVLMFVLFCHMIFPASGNNVRLNGTVKVTDVTSGVATLELDLSWDNSWRDEFNWDAVWIFVKYRSASGNWSHILLQETGHSASNGYQIMTGKSGSDVVGVFVYPGTEGVVKRASTKLTLKWPCGSGFTKSSFDNNEVFLLGQGIEMVYVPYGAYYLGDGRANLSFMAARSSFRMNNGYRDLEYSSVYGGDKFNGLYGVQNAIDDNINTHFHSAGTSDEWLIIDYGESREMHYFTIRTHYGGSSYYVEGSNDKSLWDELWRGSGSNWSQTLSRHKITNPGSYRYYRFRETGNWLVVYEVSLWEEEYPPVWVDSEEFPGLGISGTSNDIQLPAPYPKGYSGYYVMKYELSQEQYVRFLNTLTKSEQESLLGASFLSSLRPGRFIFGDTLQPSFRNGIVLRSKPEGRPYVFGHDLNDNGIYDENGDGQCIACNYLSLNDLLGYASWCGLRPMSELEYERSCRAPFPQVPEKGEYVWNTSGDVSSVTSLLSSGKETEVAGVASNVNSHNSLGSRRGPVRCGAFAGESTTQVESGGTYWGVMEMGGNVGELVANLRNTTLDKMVNGSGSFSLSTWSTSPVHYGVRGGSFAGADSLLRSSDRSQAEGYIVSADKRDSTVGIRLTRNFSAEDTMIDPGEIETNTKCPGPITVLNKKLAEGATDFTYFWYVKRPGMNTFELIPEISEAELVDFEIPNMGQATSVTYVFRRKVVASTGEAFVDLNVEIQNSKLSVSPSSGADDCAGATVFKAEVTGTVSSYGWYYGETLLSSSFSYQANRSDFSNVIGEYQIRCEAIVNGCKLVVDSLIVKVPLVQTVTSTAVTLDNCGTVRLRDERDGREYCTVRMGDFCWMNENLNYGETVPSTSGLSVGQKWCHTRANGTTGSGDCDYLLNGFPIGGLYSYDIASLICPEGWRLPYNSEWSGVNPASGNFGQLGGYRHRSGYSTSFYSWGETSYWWSVSGGSPYQSFYTDASGILYHWADTFGNYGFSVRCVKN